MMLRSMHILSFWGRQLKEHMFRTRSHDLKRPIMLPILRHPTQALLLSLLLQVPSVVRSQPLIISPEGAFEEHIPIEHAMAVDKAKDNVKTAIQFLRDWGWTKEADNIQQWFENKMILLDFDVSGAETSTTSKKITLTGSLLLCAGKEAPSLQHRFKPKDPNDMQCIAELAFTLDHEKVHAHQTYSSFILGREGNETDAYNKEIADEDATLERMEDSLDKAISKGDKALEKELLNWIGAVLTVKIDAIETWNANYPESRKLNLPDRLLDYLRELRKKNDERRKQFRPEKAADVSISPYRRSLTELNAFERSLPARQWPEYWIEQYDMPLPYVTTSTTADLQTVTFHTVNGEVLVSMPVAPASGTSLTGSMRTITKSPNDANILDAHQIRIMEQQMTVSKMHFSLSQANDASQNGTTVTLYDHKGNTIGTALIPAIKQIDAERQGSERMEDIRIPILATAGTPMVIHGPFDGDLSNTRCSIVGKPATIIAETHGKLIILSPSVLEVGPMTINVKERDLERNGTFQNLQLTMNAEKTVLRKGERTRLTVQVNGLQGFKQEAFLHLDAEGMVQMKGGERQVLTIRPNAVQKNGMWKWDRTLTATMSGSFQIAATLSGNERSQ